MRGFLVMGLLFAWNNPTLSAQITDTLYYKASAVDTLQLTTTDTLSRRKIHIISGVGWGFPMGSDTKQVFTPKFSNILGITISTDKKYLFWYPSISFLSFKYNQFIEDADYEYKIIKSRSNYYNINFAAGLKKQFSKFSLYGYLGPGIGFMAEPRAEVVPEENIVRIKNKLRVSPTWRTGIGVDYQANGFFLFFEMGWSHNFVKIQGRTLNMMVLFVGLKTDVSRIAEKVIKIIYKDERP